MLFKLFSGRKRREQEYKDLIQTSYMRYLVHVVAAIQCMDEVVAEGAREKFLEALDVTMEHLDDEDNAALPLAEVLEQLNLVALHAAVKELARVSPYDSFPDLQDLLDLHLSRVNSGAMMLAGTQRRLARRRVR